MGIPCGCPIQVLARAVGAIRYGRPEWGLELWGNFHFLAHFYPHYVVARCHIQLPMMGMSEDGYRAS